jgi:hypothetical protein
MEDELFSNYGSDSPSDSLRSSSVQAYESFNSDGVHPMNNEPSSITTTSLFNDSSPHQFSFHADNSSVSTPEAQICKCGQFGTQINGNCNCIIFSNIQDQSNNWTMQDHVKTEQESSPEFDNYDDTLNFSLDGVTATGCWDPSLDTFDWDSLIAANLEDIPQAAFNQL